MAVTEATALETVLRRDRIVVLAALVAVIVAASIWIVLGAGTGISAVAMTQMAGMPDMDAMMERAVWTPGYAGLIFAMWWVMMVAMMLPGAASIGWRKGDGDAQRNFPNDPRAPHAECACSRAFRNPFRTLPLDPIQ